MANITVTIEGDVDEVVAALRGMAGGRLPEVAPAEAMAAPPAVAEPEGEPAEPEPAMEMAAAPAPLPAVQEPEPEKAAWDASYASSFWQHLSDTARQAMLRVSRSPNHTQRRAQLMHTLRLTQRELSGSLSSQGHSLNRLKRRRNVDLPRPLNYDKTEDVYVLDPGFANALRELGMS